MTTTVHAFNTMLKNFLEELADVFPEETQIRLFLDGMDAFTAINPRGPLDLLVESLTPHAALAMAKDPALFDKLQFPGGIDFKRLWAQDVSDNTRDAIWQYINLLFMLGTTVRSMPAQMLQGIESMAESCAAQLESGQLDLSALGGLLGGGGLGELAASLAASSAGGGGGDAPAPRAPRAAGGKRRA